MRNRVLRILVVEDYTPLRRAVGRALREAGYSVDESDDGQEALHLANTRAYA